MAKLHSHLNSIADKIPPLVPDGKILLLIGRDLIDAHHVENQITGPQGAPFAQKLSLGWVIVGEVCIGKFHKADTNVNSLKTNLLVDGRTTLFDPCHSKLSVREQPVEHSIGNSLFVKTQWDEEVGTSYEDRKFMTIMDSEFTKDETGSWVAPLPFKAPRPILPDNKKQALQRAHQLESSLRRNPEKLKHFLAFMEKVINNGAAEKSSKIEDDKERWYLPIFGVYHPKKPNQVRGVFDSSVIYKGQSLNNVLLSGPNLTNSLLGVLLRFRKDQCAITADIEQMFYRFFVKPEHRDYLRFFWFQDNNPDLPMIEYRMTVHVFGNRPSPAVATYGLREAVKNSEEDIREFVNKHFYVDDALTSLPTADMAVSLLKRTRETL